MLPHCVWVDLGAMAMNGYSAFQNSRIAGAWLSDCLMSYPRHLLGESNPSVEMQSVFCSSSRQDQMEFGNEKCANLPFEKKKNPKADNIKQIKEKETLGCSENTVQFLWNKILYHLGFSDDCLYLVIFTTFRSMCPPAVRCLSNARTYTELRTMSL